MQHQKTIEAANSLLRKQELEKIHFNQPDTEKPDDKFTPENLQRIPPKSMKVPPQQVARSES